MLGLRISGISNKGASYLPSQTEIEIKLTQISNKSVISESRLDG